MVSRALVFLLLFTTQQVLAQKPPTTDQVLRELKTDTRFEDGGADWVQFSELLLSYSENPISLNTATQEELEAIPLLNKFQAYHLIKYRKRNGKIISYYELATIKGFDKQLIQWLMPFTSLSLKSENLSFSKLLSGHHQIATRFQRAMQEKKGLKNQTYSGDANALYLRYRYNYQNKVFAGITLQKDEGEPYFIPGKVYPDYNSYHLEVRDIGFAKTIIAGDFLANYGQGLALWTTNTFGKTAETTESQRFGKGIRYYSGADENRFMRGIATSLKVKAFTLDVFGSKNNIDATVNNGLASTLTESGLHRSTTEIEKRKIQNISTFGGHASWLKTNFEIGLTAFHYQFSIPIAKNEKAYAAHRFYGKSNFVTSLDYQWVVNNIILFGELAQSQSGGIALNSGFKAKVTDAITLNVAFRQLDNNYHTLYNAPFSESGNSGEQGLYLGFKYNLNSKFTLKGYVDRYKFTWLKFQTSAPSNGEDYLVQLDYKKPQALFYARYRYKQGQINTTHEQTDSIVSSKQHLVRLHAKVFLAQNIRSNTRIEMRSFNSTDPFIGYLFYQEIVGDIKNTRLRAYFRVSYFNSEDFRTTLYAREDDLPYTYNLAQFNREGIKYYVMLKYSLKKLNFYLRWAHVNYVNVESLGSGNDLIEGNIRSEIKFMLAMKL